MSLTLERSAFSINEGSGFPDWLAEKRRSAFASYQALGIPTTKDEEWKYTSLRTFSETPFTQAERTSLTEADIAPFLVGLEDAVRIVFVNGFYDEGLTTSLSTVEGLEVRTLRCVGGDPSGKLQTRFGTLVKDSEFTFGALNTAAFEEGAYVQIHRRATIERPVHLLFLSTGPVATFPRILVHAEAGSRAALVETYGTIGDAAGFTCSVVETFVESNAHLELTKAQLENESTFHIALHEAKVEQDGTFLTFNVTLGGHLTRNDINVFLNGQNVHARMDGVYVLRGDQHCDNHTRLDHAFPHCDSFEVYKGVLDDRSSGVFNGKIFVYEDAQKTDAKQTNQALLLSPTATFDTKPQLEIFADDVKCTHGATVGQLRKDALFYLRSRGVGEAEAKALLVYAFAAEVLEKISLEGLRTELERRMFEKLGVDSAGQ